MYADEPGVWFDEKELDVPTMPLEYMHIDMRDSMVGAAVMGWVPLHAQTMPATSCAVTSPVASKFLTSISPRDTCR
ncbi:hypothetical protein QEM13_004131 [Pseudomonas putida]|nr:hypothetical protein [Pseudomonas putida]